MRTSQIIITSVVSIIAVAILAGVALARDPSWLPEAPPIPDTGFTYQGLVKGERRPANGAYDFEFALFNATSGVQVGNTIIKDNLPVVNGLVSTQLDFGPGIFDGTRLLLETRTREGDQTGAFETLTSRLSAPFPTRPSPTTAHSGRWEAMQAQPQAQISWEQQLPSRWCSGPTTPRQCQSVQLGRSESVMTNPAKPIQAVCYT